MWRPRQSTVHGWYMHNREAGNKLEGIGVQDWRVYCIPRDARDNWPDEGTVQLLCDAKNMEQYGTLEPETKSEA